LSAEKVSHLSSAVDEWRNHKQIHER